MLKQAIVAVSAVIILALSAPPAQAKSQCSGLSSSACSANNTCTWRKGSVDKNGKKTKSHCRALPGKAKQSKSAASNAKSAVDSKKTSGVKKKAAAKTSAKKASTTASSSQTSKKKAAKKKSTLKNKASTTKSSASAKKKKLAKKKPK